MKKKKSKMINIDKFELIINDTNKNKFGEVFTDINLISESLSHLKFNDPKQTYYDPTCGHGYFLFFIYDILMGNGYKYPGYENVEGLKFIIKNETAREKHIIENMLFGTDIQQESIDVCNKLFKSDKYKTNFICIDFTKYETNKLFDNIVGNPPFEDNLNDKRKAKNHNLWRPIILKAYKMLADNGIMAFVCPQSWMSWSKTNADMLGLFNENAILKLNINECRKYFKGVGSSFSYFVLQKTTIKKETEVICEYKNINYNSYINFNEKNYFFPLLLTKESMSILNKTVLNKDLEKYPVKFDSYLHAFTKKDCLQKTKDSTFKYKVWHTPNAILWANKPHTSQNSWKVFIPTTTYYESLLCDKCGNTQGMGYIICNDEEDANNIKNILSLKLYRFIVNITRWSNWNSPDILKTLPKTEIGDITDEELYKFFNLTEDEIKFINEVIK